MKAVLEDRTGGNPSDYIKVPQLRGSVSSAIVSPQMQTLEGAGNSNSDGSARDEQNFPCPNDSQHLQSIMAVSTTTKVVAITAAALLTAGAGPVPLLHTALTSSLRPLL